MENEEVCGVKRGLLMSKYEEFSFFLSESWIEKVDRCVKKQGDTGEGPRNVSGLEETVMPSVCFPILQIRSPQAYK